MDGECCEGRSQEESAAGDGANRARGGHLPYMAEVPELYRSVGMAEIEKNGWSLVPSKYIEFIDHDLEIDFPKEMKRIQKEMRDILKKEQETQKMLKAAFKGIGYGLDAK